MEKAFCERVPGGTQGLETLISRGCVGALPLAFRLLTFMS